jgi:hypothetical protein
MKLTFSIKFMVIGISDLGHVSFRAKYEKMMFKQNEKPDQDVRVWRSVLEILGKIGPPRAFHSSSGDSHLQIDIQSSIRQ